MPQNSSIRPIFMYSVIGIVVLVLTWIGWNYFKPQTVRNRDSTGTTIVAFGDSLVQGVGATLGNDWVSKLSDKIGQPIINRGVSGNTTADALARIDTVLADDPKVVIILLGGNDYLKRIPIETTFANLDTIVRMIQEKGSAVLLLGVRGGLLRDTYGDDFEKFAESHETAFVPNVLDGLIGDKTRMFDTIHPNDTGYALIVEKVYPVLQKLLKK
jgi:acyl-CoA thioesterase-1